MSRWIGGHRSSSPESHADISWSLPDVHLGRIVQGQSRSQGNHLVRNNLPSSLLEADGSEIRNVIVGNPDGVRANRLKIIESFDGCGNDRFTLARQPSGDILDADCTFKIHNSCCHIIEMAAQPTSHIVPAAFAIESQFSRGQEITCDGDSRGDAFLFIRFPENQIGRDHLRLQGVVREAKLSDEAHNAADGFRWGSHLPVVWPAKHFSVPSRAARLTTQKDIGTDQTDPVPRPCIANPATAML